MLYMDRRARRIFSFHGEPTPLGFAMSYAISCPIWIVGVDPLIDPAVKSPKYARTPGEFVHCVYVFAGGCLFVQVYTARADEG